MKTSDFDYTLPPELIAQTPMEPRDHSRLLVLDRTAGAMEHRRFFHLPAYLRAGDVLVLNDSRVRPARIRGRRADTGGVIELLLLRHEERDLWRCLGRPGRRLRRGTPLVLGEDPPLEANVEELLPGGVRLVRFAEEPALDRIGEVPLPPYIRQRPEDPERYQTVYSREPGSAAAPTAGLHFTPELLRRCRDMGVEQAFVTLHVGLDTFRPVQTEDPRQHQLHTESWEIGAGAAETLNNARSQGRRIVAVGTTAVRVLEHAALRFATDDGWHLEPSSGWADLFILPGHPFRVVDALITNFHLPRSTLLMLVGAFGGREPVLRAYREAIREGYRFYSFGDAMLIV